MGRGAIRRGGFLAAGAVLSGLLGLGPTAASGQQGENVRVVGQIGGDCLVVHLENNYAYVGEGPSMRILDVTSPSCPFLLSSVTLPGYVRKICTSGTLAYVAADSGGLHVIDASNPSSPRVRGSYEGIWAQDVHVSGSLAYVAAGVLLIIDVSDPSSPTLCGSYETIGLVWNVHVSGSLAYVSVSWWCSWGAFRSST